MNRLTIGEFNESFPPLMDGVGQVVKNYTYWLRQQGENAYAVVGGTKEAPDYDVEHGVDYSLRCRMYSLPGLAPYGPVIKDRKFKKSVRAKKFDIVHAHSPFYLGKFAEKIAKEQGVPLVSTFHTQFKDDIQGAVHIKWITNLATKFVLRHYYKADEVWTPSELSKKKLQEYGFTGRIVVMENGCDMVVPTSEEYVEFRQKGFSLINLDDTSVPVLLYVGQHKVEKNLLMVFDSLKLLKERGVRFKMVFVGIGPDKPLFEQTVTKYGLTDSVLFLGRITDRVKLQYLYSCASLFLFPSLYDTSCLVMREAAAFWLPLLYITGSCTAEPITDGGNGFLADNNAESYADRIQWVCENSEEQKKAGVGAQSTLYRSWEMVVKDVDARYRSLIEA